MSTKNTGTGAASRTKKWKPPIWLYITLSIMALYPAFAIGSIWTSGELLINQMSAFNTFAEKPFSFNWHKMWGENLKITLMMILLLEMAVLIYVIYDLTKPRNFMPDREYGVADWGVVEKINRKFASENEKENRIYSESLRIGMDGDKTRINNNVLVVGGSGVGKSVFLLTPNLYQANTESRFPGSFIITDPKGELLQRNGALLRERGYRIKVVNLVPGMMHESDRFNPFRYIRSEADIIKLINNLFANTTPKDASKSDPFWEKAELMFLNSLFLLVWMESDRYGWEMSFNTVMDLINNAEVTEEGNSELDYTFNKLVADTMNEPNGGFKHPAYLAYHKSMGGEKDNVRTIILSAQVRLATLDNPEVRRILSDDELDLASIGTGQTIKGEKNVKTALFCVIPDSDTTYNCIAGMIYTLLFQELYFQADFKFGGKLPVPVTFWMDEFANIALPNDFPKLLSTMRSRAISCVIIVQNLSQLKELYKDYWERIPSDCDVFIYLGGNEQASFKYLSENMGDKTIRKKSTGESKGRNGSTSVNTDGLGRKLMLPEEVRELDNDYCIVFVRGQKPILDHKFRTLEAADFKRSKELGPYIHSQCKKLDNDIKIQLYDKKLHNVPPNGIEIDLEQYTSYITDDELARIIAENDEEGFDNEKEIDITDMSIEEILSLPELSLSDDELVEVTTGIYNGLTDEEIKSYILFGDAKRMKSQRLLLEALRARSMVSQG